MKFLILNLILNSQFFILNSERRPMKIILTIFLVINFLGCGIAGRPEFDSLMDDLPRVISIYPEDEGFIDVNDSIEVQFSVSLTPETVNDSTFAVVRFENDMGDKAELVDDVVDGDIYGVEGELFFYEDDTKVLFTPSDQLIYGKSYIIVITNQVMSSELLPLTQHPGLAGSPFISTFVVGAGGEGDVAGGGSANPSEFGEIERNRPQNLIVNEVLYDVAGSDTDGDVFIELYGDPGGDITDYKVYLVNGDDGIIKDTIKIPANTIIPDDGIFLIADSKTGQSGVSDVANTDLIDNFDPQNGPDCIQLVDHEGNLIDSIGYGEGIVPLAENGLACYEGMPAPKVSSGQSLSRIGAIDSNDNLADFVVLDVPSPGGL